MISLILAAIIFSTPTPPPPPTNAVVPPTQCVGSGCNNIYKMAPTLDVSCPDYGNPVGWGLVTPDAIWNSLCSQCVTPLPSPTIDFDKLYNTTPTPCPGGPGTCGYSTGGTPVATSTPYVYSSVTPAPTISSGYFYDISFQPGPSCQDASGHTVNGSAVPYGNGVKVDYDFICNVNGNGSGARVFWSDSRVTDNSNTWYQPYYLISTYSGYVRDDSLLRLGGTYISPLAQSDYYNPLTYAQGASQKLEINLVGWAEVTGTIYIMPNPYAGTPVPTVEASQTPLVTPTVSSSGYCKTVSTIPSDVGFTNPFQIHPENQFCAGWPQTALGDIIQGMENLVTGGWFSVVPTIFFSWYLPPFLVCGIPFDSVAVNTLGVMIDIPAFMSVLIGGVILKHFLSK